MRIATSQYSQTMNTALQTANAGLTRVMSQMASGSRILKPSDDTIATVRLARLSREEAALDQYRSNITALTTRLQNNETTLTSMQDDLLMVRDLMVWAADGASTPDDVKAMATALQSLRDSLFYSANTRNAEGQYMFSGTASNVATLDLTAGVYSFGAGVDNTTQQVAVGDGVTIAANVALSNYGLDVFLNGLQAAITAFGNGSYTSATAGGQLKAVDDLMDFLSGQIAQQGGRRNVINTLDDNHAAVSLSNQEATLALGKVDYAEAAIRLNSYELAVQATQKAYARVSNLSLFDVL
ncbi:flagellar hook-associated protein FlgL [Roseateles sp.]|uniref:flagellar hook-associated protein FlgL n=1 Tax=Roseateles sp. TaxID=1971397 RepID=UPI0025EACFCC|nr:flagellar hook-associated protein FlgL [Roseateles sp.]MBV8036758.1 flagellar hook-associated protein FlgL [Roseateles sp.]